MFRAGSGAWRAQHPITRIRRNMKNDLRPTAEKLMLRKQFLIETVRDILNPKWGVSIHAPDRNAMVHVPSCIVAYAFRPSKPPSR